jgi:hypothetical protein
MHWAEGDSAGELFGRVIPPFAGVWVALARDLGMEVWGKPGGGAIFGRGAAEDEQFGAMLCWARSWPGARAAIVRYLEAEAVASR